MKKRILALVVASLVGALLGYLLSSALNYGWFKSKWLLIEKPPIESFHLVAISRDSLWIMSDTGAIYFNENSSSCTNECWSLVSEVPSLPIVEPFETNVTNEACAPTPPLSKIIDTISECRHEMWVDRSYKFSLRWDGNIYLWEADHYGEWTSVSLLSGVCTGAIILFVPTLLFVLFSGLLGWLSKHANKELKEKTPLPFNRNTSSRR